MVLHLVHLKAVVRIPSFSVQFQLFSHPYQHCKGLPRCGPALFLLLFSRLRTLQSIVLPLQRSLRHHVSADGPAHIDRCQRMEEKGAIAILDMPAAESTPSKRRAWRVTFAAGA